MNKTHLAAAVLSCAAGTFAYDEYGTVKASSFEADVMYTHTFINGYYNDNGDNKDVDGSPATMNPALQLKYGIIDGLDIEAVVPFQIQSKDAGDGWGLNKPQIDFKYLNPIGVGALVGVDLPSGGKDIVGSDPALALRGGVILSKNIDRLALNGWALYTHNFEAGSVQAADWLDFYIKPQYNITDKIGPYLGIEYGMSIGDAKRNQDVTYPDVDDEGNITTTTTTISVSGDPKQYLLTLKPGVNYTINDKFGAEVNVPVTILGQNQFASVSIYAGFYSTFSL